MNTYNEKFERFFFKKREEDMKLVNGFGKSDPGRDGEQEQRVEIIRIHCRNTICSYVKLQVDE